MFYTGLSDAEIEEFCRRDPEDVEPTAPQIEHQQIEKIASLERSIAQLQGSQIRATGGAGGG